MLALILAAAASLPAASAAPPEAVDTRPRSIYEVHPVLDGALIAGGALAGLIPYVFAKDLIHPKCPCDPASVNAFDRGSIGDHSHFADVLSDVTVDAAVIVPVLVDLLDVGLRAPFVEDMTVYAEVMALNTGLVSVTKAVVQRPLPRVYALQAPKLIDTPNGYRSFYSGHTSTTMAALGAFSMTWALRHGDSAFQRTWPFLVSGLVGASVGAERVFAGRHFISDVLVGGVVGSAFGVLVPWLHARPGSPTVAVAPREGGMAVALSLRL
jgi:membrane-associated phospholipid phosphatase